MSDNDVNKAVDKMTPEQEIAFIRSSPMPADEKARRIAEVEQKAGIKASAPAGPGVQTGTN